MYSITHLVSFYPLILYKYIGLKRIVRITHLCFYHG